MESNEALVNQLAKELRETVDGFTEKSGVLDRLDELERVKLVLDAIDVINIGYAIREGELLNDLDDEEATNEGERPRLHLEDEDDLEDDE